MANLGSLLKSEITRLARKEVKAQTEALRKSNAALRRDIAALKRQAAELQRQLAALRRLAPVAKTAPSTETAKVRFSAKGLQSHRARLGLSAAEYGQLVGVSGQSIYNWESGKATPRIAQVKLLAGLRHLGQRAARAQLEPKK